MVGAIQGAALLLLAGAAAPHAPRCRTPAVASSLARCKQTAPAAASSLARCEGCPDKTQRRNGGMRGKPWA